MYHPIIRSSVTTDGAPCYLAYMAEAQGCIVQGDTPAEALLSLRTAWHEYCAIAREYGAPIPAPFADTARTMGGDAALVLDPYSVPYQE